MADENKWAEFFDQHAPYYLQNEFTTNTGPEVESIWPLMRMTRTPS